MLKLLITSNNFHNLKMSSIARFCWDYKGLLDKKINIFILKTILSKVYEKKHQHLKRKDKMANEKFKKKVKINTAVSQLVLLCKI